MTRDKQFSKRDVVIEILDEWKPRQDLRGESLQGILLNPVPVAYVAVVNAEFIARSYCADNNDGAISSEPDVVIVLIDIVVDATKASHRVIRVGGAIQYLIEGAGSGLKKIITTGSRKSTSVDTYRIVTRFDASLIEPEEESKGTGTNFDNSAWKNLKSGNAVSIERLHPSRRIPGVANLTNSQEGFNSLVQVFKPEGRSGLAFQRRRSRIGVC